MSNSPIYEEFKKTVGKNSVRNIIYVRTQCKNCNSIIEYGKHHHKTHKGYCGKAISKMSAFAFSNLKKIQEAAEKAEEPKEVVEEKDESQPD